MRKRLLTGGLLALLALAVLVAGWGNAEAQDKSLYWQRYDVNLNVQLNSDILVEEIQDIQFTSGTFRFGYAAIPLDRVQQITDVSVSELVDGKEVAYTPGSTSEYGFETQTYEGNLEITWYFPPTSNSDHTYILRYRVIGGLRIYEGGDQLWWKAIAPDHNFPIQSSRVVVTLPDTFPQDQLVVDSYGSPADASYNERAQVVFTAENIPADEELEVRVQFPHGVVQGAPPAWQASFDRRQEWGPIVSIIFGGLGLLLLVAGPLGIYLLWYTRGRDQSAGLVAEYITEPPSDMSAGLVGTLIDESADMKDIIATLMDLARRGAIRIEEERTEGFLGIGSGSDFIFHLEDSNKASLPHEKTLIDKIFGGRKERSLSDLRQKFYTVIPKLKNQMYKALVDQGFFPSDPNKVRSKWTCLGIAGVFVSVAMSITLLTLLGSFSLWVACPGVSLLVTMVAMLIAARAMPRKTARGVEEATKWLAFKRYLQTIEQHAELDSVKDKFESFLPYAVAFGLERRLIKQFEAIDTPAPSWWGPVFVPTYGHPYPGGGPLTGSSMGHTGGPPGPLADSAGAPTLSDMSKGMGSSLSSMSEGLGAMLSSAGSVFTSTPPSSSSSGGFGGGGFSGGGFSGGGGGGGGSRGFG